VLKISLGSKKPLYIDPECMGTYRELYGIYDSISLATQSIQSQIGSNETSIFEVFNN
jgi:hypothetical protein